MYTEEISPELLEKLHNEMPVAELTFFSVLNTVVMTAIIIILFIFITKRLKSLTDIPIGLIYAAVIIIGIRLLMPLKLRRMHIVSSYIILETVRIIVDSPVTVPRMILGGGYKHSQCTLYHMDNGRGNKPFTLCFKIH